MLSATGAIASIIYKMAVLGVTLSEKKMKNEKEKKQCRYYTSLLETTLSHPVSLFLSFFII